MSHSPLVTSEAEGLWNQLRVVFSKLDETHVLQDIHLRSAYPLHEELAKNYNPKDLPKWKEVIHEYKLTLDALKQEEHCLHSAQTALAELHSILYPEEVGSFSKSSSLDSKKIKKRHSGTDFKRPQISLPHITITPGSDVAVRVPSAENPDKDEWIWAKVVSINESGYEVEDVDNKKILRITDDSLIPLIPEDYPDFPPGTTLLANYPDTTAFYKAVVHTVFKNDKEYLVSFDEDHESYQKVPKRLLVPYVAEKIDRP